MVLYHSTRSREPSVPSRRAIEIGCAPDGGLFVADEIAAAKQEVAGLISKGYPQIAREVLGLLLPDFTAGEIAACVKQAYTGSFADREITPLVDLGARGADGGTHIGPKTWILELFGGPTSAFKDVALQMLPHLMAHAVEGAPSAAAGSDGRAEAHAGRIMIVTATSGDTGKAALAGFADAPGCGITVFYPHGQVSEIQRLQMSAQRGANVTVRAVRGNFDDAQTAVKRLFADRELAGRLAGAGVALSSANSINIGRLAPQVVYYFSAYAQLLRSRAIRPGDPIEFCVPTGNFGNVLAGYYAKRLGLPISRLLVASDRNNVLFDFLTTGVYDRRRPFFTTTSPSMDILISSNLERMLFHLSEGDCELVSHLMGRLAEEGRYEVPEALLERIRTVFGCGWADEGDVARAIRSCWDAHGYLIDPHTACGSHVLAREPPAPGSAARVLLATASPYKFPHAIADALGIDAPADDFACMRAVELCTGIPAPAQLAALACEPVRFSDVIDVRDVPAAVETAARRLAGAGA